MSFFFCIFYVFRASVSHVALNDPILFYLCFFCFGCQFYCCAFLPFFFSFRVDIIFSIFRNNFDVSYSDDIHEQLMWLNIGQKNYLHTLYVLAQRLFVRTLKTFVPKACEAKQQFYELSKCQKFVRLLLLLWNGILLNAQCTKRRRQALWKILNNVCFANRNERISARLKQFANNFFRPF